jgi:hypothetical protein
METGSSVKPSRNLRDFEALIEKGYVLDVRGQWIPLDEKIKKEQSFSKHLEAGEVLLAGKWAPIAQALKAGHRHNKTGLLKSQTLNENKNDSAAPAPLLPEEKSEVGLTNKLSQETNDPLLNENPATSEESDNREDTEDSLQKKNDSETSIDETESAELTNETDYPAETIMIPTDEILGKKSRV